MPMIKISRRQLNEAIIDLIFLHGYDACTMQMIADKLNITKASLYHYGNKESIVLTALKDYDDDPFKHFYCGLKIYMSGPNYKNIPLIKEAKKRMKMYSNLRVVDVITKYHETIASQHKQ